MYLQADQNSKKSLIYKEKISNCRIVFLLLLFFAPLPV